MRLCLTNKINYPKSFLLRGRNFCATSYLDLESLRNGLIALGQTNGSTDLFGLQLVRFFLLQEFGYIHGKIPPPQVLGSRQKRSSALLDASIDPNKAEEPVRNGFKAGRQLL